MDVDDATQRPVQHERYLSPVHVTGARAHLKHRFVSDGLGWGRQRAAGNVLSSTPASLTPTPPCLTDPFHFQNIGVTQQLQPTGT